ncbi:hypothetical protein FRB90_005003 [Tulasnella sp. 427]|nr:hypothetical protein FRB90_005003 [Tulasnella sp. 427]
MPSEKAKEKPVHALIAGATAGAIEDIPYGVREDGKSVQREQGGVHRMNLRNLESLKALFSQLGPIGIIRTTIQDKGIAGLYSGCGALVTGNALKAGVRFVSYDRYKSLLADSEGKVLRQGANSAVRFTSYSTLKQFVQGNARPGQTLSSGLTFAIGGLAGLITVYTTMPLDVVKTRMQSLEAKQLYKNSFHCAYKVWQENGILGFWKGTTPRLARLVMAGGIVFTVYEKVIVLIGGRSL